MVRYGRVSPPKIFPPIPGSHLRQVIKEQIIAHQQQHHQERGSPDTIQMVSGDVSQTVEYLVQEGMSTEQLYQALRDVRERLAPVLTGRQQQD